LTLNGGWAPRPGTAECEELPPHRSSRGAAHPGSVEDDVLARAYREADMFVCLSDHEGFCVPLLEAMSAGLPIVAYAAGAVPETVGAAGLLLPEKPPSLVAEAIMAVLDDPSLGEAMAAARPERLAHLEPQAVAARMRAALEALGVSGVLIEVGPVSRAGAGPGPAPRSGRAARTHRPARGAALAGGPRRLPGLGRLLEAPALVAVPAGVDPDDP